MNIDFVDCLHFSSYEIYVSQTDKRLICILKLRYPIY